VKKPVACSTKNWPRRIENKTNFSSEIERE
jgi:hypothetical protein